MGIRSAACAQALERSNQRAATADAKGAYDDTARRFRRPPRRGEGARG
jgi:hypothetical protein